MMVICRTRGLCKTEDGSGKAGSRYEHAEGWNKLGLIVKILFDCFSFHEFPFKDLRTIRILTKGRLVSYKISCH